MTPQPRRLRRPTCGRLAGHGIPEAAQRRAGSVGEGRVTSVFVSSDGIFLGPHVEVHGYFLFDPTHKCMYSPNISPLNPLKWLSLGQAISTHGPSE